MKINNCLFCNCHIDNREYYDCKYKRHKFSITEKQSQKYNRDIKYIKDEINSGRHIIASLGSAGYTFLDDIGQLANYAHSQGDKAFYKELIK